MTAIDCNKNDLSPKDTLIINFCVFFLLYLLLFYKIQILFNHRFNCYVIIVLQVATAQLEAIRLENRHLRRSAVSGSRSNLADSADLVETEKHLKEIQSAYGETVKSLEVG